MKRVLSLEEQKYIIARVELGRFEKYVTRGKHWIWIGSLDSSGYGRMAISRPGHKPYHVFVGAHKMARLLYEGLVDPPELEVCHACDTPNCVRPAHLFLGTHAENMHDMKNKGRQGKGEQLSDLTNADVRRIRAAFAAGFVSAFRLAQQYGVTQSNIYAIAAGKSWRHLL